MHRLIVTSATYRQVSDVRPELDATDPENTLLSRQSRLRLPAELVRDAALAASGLARILTIGGPSVRPPQPAGVAELRYGNGGSGWKSKGADRYRRGLYIHFQRTTPYPLLMNFDAPGFELWRARAERRSNTPLQALNLLNDPVFVEAAQALAAVRSLRNDGEGRDSASGSVLGSVWLATRAPGERKPNRRAQRREQPRTRPSCPARQLSGEAARRGRRPGLAASRRADEPGRIHHAGIA